MICIPHEPIPQPAEKESECFKNRGPHMTYVSRSAKISLTSKNKEIQIISIIMTNSKIQLKEFL